MFGEDILKKDPFWVKRYPKWSPSRFIPTFCARAVEYISRLRYTEYSLPYRSLSNLPEAPDADWSDTSVTPKQMRYLLRAFEYASSGACVEVGSFRGVTTRCVGQYIHPRRVYAIDPYSGYGGAEEDYNLFYKRTADLSNVIHLGKTSGEAAREWSQERDIEISFVFVDAVHDYWNTSYDLRKWGELLSRGGVLAAHDTDRKQFAGTRRAVSEQISKNFSLLAHIENLALLKKDSHRDT